MFGVSAASTAAAFGSGWTPKNATFEPPAVLAVTFANAGLMTALVEATKVVALLPAAITTLAGTLTTGWSLDRKIVVPPAGAGVVSPTKPRIVWPPMTVDASNTAVRMPGVAD